MSTFNEHLQWRYAVKKFDAAKKLTEAQLHSLLDAARLAPSSYGLQPYRVMVITEPALRARIRHEAAHDQPQVTDASHLTVLCAKTGIDDAFIDAHIAHIAAVRGVTVQSLQTYREAMANSVKRKTPEQLILWCQKQAYIALGFLLAACAEARIDACPMEGFDPHTVDGILGLQDHGLTATVFCPVGFRASDDPAALRKKVRIPMEEFVIIRP